MIGPLCDHIYHAGGWNKRPVPYDHPFFHPNASWKRMYLTQPPLKTLSVQYTSSSVHPGKNAVWKLRRQFGTMLYNFYRDCDTIVRLGHSIDIEQTLIWFRQLDDYAQLERLSK